MFLFLSFYRATPFRKQGKRTLKVNWTVVIRRRASITSTTLKEACITRATTAMWPKLLITKDKYLFPLHLLKNHMHLRTFAVVCFVLQMISCWKQLSDWFKKHFFFFSCRNGDVRTAHYKLSSLGFDIKAIRLNRSQATSKYNKLWLTLVTRNQTLLAQGSG